MDPQLAWSREAQWAARPHHVGDARTFVLDCLAEEGLQRVSHALALVVSELATNVVLHAHTPFTVTVARRDTWLVLEVRDHLAGRVAVPEPTDEVELSGRGLEIVQALSAAWGVWPRRDGKSVWAAFDLDVWDGVGAGSADGAASGAAEGEPSGFTY